MAETLPPALILVRTGHAGITAFELAGLDTADGGLALWQSQGWEGAEEECRED